jgi:hypothetical protein
MVEKGQMQVGWRTVEVIFLLQFKANCTLVIVGDADGIATALHFPIDLGINIET